MIRHRRTLSATIVALAAATLATTGVGSAAAQRLPDGGKSVTSTDGTKVTITRTGEQVVRVASMSATPAGRAAAVTGTIRSRISDLDAHGSVRVGYIVGCQMDIGDIEIGYGTSFSATSFGLSGSLSLALAPGESRIIEFDKRDIRGGASFYRYQDVSIEVRRCGGPAQARSFAEIQVRGANFVKSTLYGHLFTIG